MPGPLDRVRILDFTEIIAGPFGAMLLADMGADVIKVEPPWGEPWRVAQEFVPLESRTYLSLNRGKRSLPLDLTKPKSRDIVYKLIPSIDVVIINYRPDVPYKLGIDYETLAAINPRLIYCENTAFGPLGPHSQRPGYDIIIQAMSGLMAGDSKMVGGVPQQVTATAVADYATGLAIAWGVCGALYARECTGSGQKLEATLLATALALQGTPFLQVDAIDREARTEFIEDITLLRDNGRPYHEVFSRYEATRTKPVQNIYYRTYQTKDSVLAVGCLSDPLRKKMATALNLRDIRFEVDYDPASDEAYAFAQEITSKTEMIFLEKTTKEWCRILDAAGVPCGPVKFVEELLEDEQVLANDLVVELEHSIVGSLKMVGPTLKMSDTPLGVKSASPALGEHTNEILGNLGYSRYEIQKLRDEGVTR
ncbi:CoA transferase [Dehalococcoidia bacterium]|nr:CoA transferase [Dehalococcoidia bacterium]